MKCFICDRSDDLITYDKVRQEYGPCTVCQAIIQETIEGYGDPEFEDEFEMDHTRSGQDDRSHGESVESDSATGRSSREAYSISFET